MAAPHGERQYAVASPREEPRSGPLRTARPARTLTGMSAPPSDMGERLAALAGRRPWWPLAEPSKRWIRVRLGPELVADSRRALLLVQYGPGVLPRSFLPTYFVPADDVVPGTLVDPVEEDGLTVWAVQAGGRRLEGAAWMHRAPPAPLEALAGLVTFSWDRGLTWLEED